MMAAINVKVYVCAVGTVTLTYSLLKFMDMPLLILYVFICIQTSSIENFDTRSFFLYSHIPYRHWLISEFYSRLCFITLSVFIFNYVYVNWMYEF